MNIKLLETKKLFSEDLFLAKCFLIVEAIEANTLESIKITGIKMSQAIGHSDAVKNSKLLKLDEAIKVANLFIKRSFNITDTPDIKVFRERAGKLIAAMEFFFMIQDFAVTLSNESENIAKIFSEYQQAGSTPTDSDVASTDSTTNQDQQEKIEDPTIEMLLEANESKALVLRLMQLFSRRAKITKDPQSAAFFKATNDLRNSSYVIVPPSNYRYIATDITKLTFSQFQNLIKILQILANMISRIRTAIGSATPEEIRTKLLGEPTQ